MGTTILRLHSAIVYFMVVVTVVTIAKLLIGSFRQQAYGKVTRWLMWIFTGLNTVQWAVGVGLLVALGNFSNIAFWTHAGTMTVAVIVSYLPYRWRRADDAVRYKRTLMVVVSVLVLVIIGVIFLLGSHKKQS